MGGELILDSEIKAFVQRVAIEHVRDLREETIKRGHSNTGELINSIEIEVKIIPNGYRGSILWNAYGNIVDSGVKPNRIPFRLGSGKRESAFIKGLVDFFRKRGVPEKKRLGFAFATAKVQAREGMSTRASRRFSKNGRRNGMSKEVLRTADRKYNVSFDRIDTIKIIARGVKLIEAA